MGLPLAAVLLLAAGLRLVAGQRHLARRPACWLPVRLLQAHPQPAHLPPAHLQPALLPPVPPQPVHLLLVPLRPVSLLPVFLLPVSLLPVSLLPPAVGRRRFALARRPLLSASCRQEAQRRPWSRRAAFAVSSQWRRVPRRARSRSCSA